MVIDDILKEADGKMDKSVEAAREEFAAIRAGRANPSMFAKLTADYYGTPTPIQQLAGFTAPEARIILVQPYDVGAMAAIALRAWRREHARAQQGEHGENALHQNAPAR